MWKNVFYNLTPAYYPDSAFEWMSVVFSLKGVAPRVLDMNTLKTAELQRTIEPMQLINSFHLFSFGIYMLGLPEKKKVTQRIFERRISVDFVSKLHFL